MTEPAPGSTSIPALAEQAATKAPTLAVSLGAVIPVEKNPGEGNGNAVATHPPPPVPASPLAAKLRDWIDVLDYGFGKLGRGMIPYVIGGVSAIDLFAPSLWPDLPANMPKEWAQMLLTGSLGYLGFNIASPRRSRDDQQ